MAPSISHYVSMWSHYQPAQCRNAHLDLEFPNTCFDHDRKAMLIDLDRCQPTTENGWLGMVYPLGGIWLNEEIQLRIQCEKALNWQHIQSLFHITGWTMYIFTCHRRMRNPHIRCHNLSKSMRQIMCVAPSMHVLFWLKDEKPLPCTISHKAINTAIDNVEVCCQQIAYIDNRGKICDKINMS